MDEKPSLGGFAQAFVNMLNIDLKSNAQNVLNDAVDENTLSVALPDELKDVVEIDEAHFRTDANGHLWLSGSGNLRSILRKHLHCASDFGKKAIAN